MTQPPPDSVPQDVLETAQQLFDPRPMRRGSVSERYIKCGKPGCPCGEDPQARHGPYTSLTRAVAGKTGSRYLSPDQAEKAGQQVQAAHEFRQRLEAYWHACERWADRELEAAAGLDLEALERAVRQQVLEFAAQAVEHHLNQDRSDTAPAQNCRCGEQARYAGRRPKRFQTVLGEMRLQRAYYCCRSCGHGFYPRDQELGLEGQSYSPALARMVAITASSVSFQEGSDLLSELAGVLVGAKEVERWGEVLGEEIIRYEQEVVEPEAETSLAPTLYLGMDGTGLPMRPTEVQGRAGQQPDGSARTRESM